MRVRLYLWAEGPTEQTFATSVLIRALADSGVYLHNPLLIAHAKKKGKIHRGGGRKYQPMKNDILRLMAQEKGHDVFFTTMIDLYAIHRDFPGLAEAEPLRRDPYARVEHLQKAWREDIEDPRFVPFIQLHEYEGYLFVNPDAFRLFYENADRQIRHLREIADRYDSPELIDDGAETAPSKRIISEFPDYEKAKATIGPQVAAKIGMKQIRDRCPHFDSWLRKLETLGRSEVT